MEWHAGLAGNAFVTNYTPGRLRVLRDMTANEGGDALGLEVANGVEVQIQRNAVVQVLPKGSVK